MKTKRFKKLLLVLTLVVSFSNLLLAGVLAQDDGRIVITPPDETGVESFKLPTFLNFNDLNVFQMAGLILTLVFVGLAIVWVVMIVRAAADSLRSDGNEELLTGARKKFGGVFWSITFLFGFFVGIALLGSFLGIGSFWDWPKVFSRCTSGNYYFQLALALPGVNTDVACFTPEVLVVGSCAGQALTCAANCGGGNPLLAVFTSSCTRDCRDAFTRCLNEADPFDQY